MRHIPNLSDVHLPDGLKRHGTVSVVADGALGQPRDVGAEEGEVEVEVGERLQHTLCPPPLTSGVEQQDLEGRLLVFTFNQDGINSWAINL